MRQNGDLNESERERFSRELALKKNWDEAGMLLERWFGWKRLAALPSPSTQEVKRPTSDVGIWQCLERDGVTEFIRDSSGADQWLWAQTPKIGSKQNRKRIVLIGESVANGYPFSPLFSCASALQQMFLGLPEGESIEVVDITR